MLLPDAGTLSIFVLASLALLVVPGPAVLYIVARSIDQGRAAGLVSVLGVTVGSAVHIVAAALGLSAVLVGSATAFNVVKYAGAAYLIVLGIRKLRERDRLVQVDLPDRARLWSIFRQGVIVNILNPKTALFFFAFLPQFVTVSDGSPAPQILMLGVVFLILALASDGTYALLSARVGALLRGNVRFARMQRRLAGCVFLGLGLLTALTGVRPEQT
jgi:threonine/homoserine/homoserine lactone efflux protein